MPYLTSLSPKTPQPTTPVSTGTVTGIRRQPRTQKPSFIDTLGAVHNRAHADAAMAGQVYKGPRMTDEEPENESVVSCEIAYPAKWSFITRMDLSTWEAKQKKALTRETEGLYSLIWSGCDLAAVAVGWKWGLHTSSDLRGWLDISSKQANRFNTSPVALALGVKLVLGLCHVDLEAGPGRDRPTRPHWHFVLAVSPVAGESEEAKQKRVDAALLELTALIGYVVQWKTREFFSQPRPAKEGEAQQTPEQAVAAMAKYLFAYPIKLRTPEDEKGNRKVVPLMQGLHLMPRLAGASTLKQQFGQDALQVLNDALAHGVDPASWAKLGAKYEGEVEVAAADLTHPMALACIYEALFQFVCLRYSSIPKPPRAKKSAACKKEKEKELTPEEKAAVENAAALQAILEEEIEKEEAAEKKKEAAERKERRAARVYGDNHVLFKWTADIEGVRCTFVRVKNFTTRADLEACRDDLRKAWDAERLALAAVRAARKAKEHAEREMALEA